MIISHNMLAINANRQYGLVTKSKAKTTEKLASGYKINRAADDAAGLSISEKMRRQIRGLTQGVANSQDGVSLCQVADGALHEVNDMLHRITELSIQSANGTNSESDRQAIQEEIDEILTEIDRIGDTTKFNELYVFRGYDETVEAADGNAFVEGDIPFSDFKLANVNLGQNPFEAGDHANHLALQAIVDNPASPAHGKTYDLIYDNGGTSNTSIRINFKNAVTNTDTNNTPSGTSYNLSQFQIQNYQYDAATNTWSRDYYLSDQKYGDLELIITQKVTPVETSATEKNYKISYEVKEGANNQLDFGVELFFHSDSAYNNDDYCESYYMNGTRLDATGLYYDESAASTQNMSSMHNWFVLYDTTVPDSFSIVDEENALAFTEKISFGGVQSLMGLPSADTTKWIAGVI